MKFSYEKEPILEALNALSKLVSASENKVFWMSIDDKGQVKFVASDGNNYCQINPLDVAKSEEAVVLCLPYNEINTFISNIKSDTILFVVKEDKIVCGVSGEKGRYSFSRYNLPCPEMPNVDELCEKGAEIDSMIFLESLQKTSFAVHPSKNKAPMTSVRLEINRKYLQSYSTDMGRISKFKHEFEIECDFDEMIFYVPKQCLDNLLSLPFGADVKIRCNEKLMEFSSADNFVYVGVQESDGNKFPNLDIFFTDEIIASATMSLKELSDKLSLADALTRGEDRLKKRMMLSLEKEYLAFKSVGTKTTIEDVISCEDVEILQDKSLKVIIPVHRIMEAIKIYDEMEVRFSLVSPPSGIQSVDLFIMLETDNWRYLILTIAKDENESD